MKAGELKKILTRIPPDTEVVLAVDEEGNGFSYLEEVCNEEAFQLYDEQPHDCIVLWPSHETFQP